MREEHGQPIEDLRRHIHMVLYLSHKILNTGRVVDTGNGLATHASAGHFSIYIRTPYPRESAIPGKYVAKQIPGTKYIDYLAHD